MQAPRSWNQFKWYHSTPPLSPSPPTPPSFSSSTLQPHSLFPPLSLCTRFNSTLIWVGENAPWKQAQLSFQWCIYCSLYIGALFLCISCTKQTAEVETCICKLGCRCFFLSHLRGLNEERERKKIFPQVIYWSQTEASLKTRLDQLRLEFFFFHFMSCSNLKDSVFISFLSLLPVYFTRVLLSLCVHSCLHFTCDALLASCFWCVPVFVLV